jgi:type I restriction enzyme S subunit
MIANLKPYSAMKDSGVLWLGDVPEHWETLPARAAFKPRQLKNTGMIEKTVLSLSYGRIVVKPPEKLRGLVPESFETYQIVDPGNIIVRTTDLQNDHTSLRIGHSQHRGIITSAYMCLQTTAKISNEFGYQFLNAYDLLKIIYGFGSGLRQNLDFNDIKRMPVLVPPLPEQFAIVRFLDHADRRIRRYIRAKQKLITLLEEQKQAIIRRAVTRGLDPNVPLKPSGVEWLGDVPEHWEVTVAKRMCAVFIPQRDKPELNEIEGIPWVTLENVGNTFIKPPRFYVRDKDAQAVGSRTVPSGSVLASCVGRFGITSITTGPVVINQQIQAYIPKVPLSQFFLRYSVLIAKPYFETQGNSTTLAYVDRDGFGGMPLLIPPRPEQVAIVRYLEDATANVEVAIERAERQISLLREYRTCLIADVVTGKLDVREAASRLPEETEESELLDECEGLADLENRAEDTDLAAETEEIEA